MKDIRTIPVTCLQKGDVVLLVSCADTIRLRLEEIQCIDKYIWTEDVNQLTRSYTRQILTDQYHIHLIRRDNQSK